MGCVLARCFFFLNQVHEDDISAVIEAACDSTKASGRWMTEFDVVEVGEGRLRGGRVGDWGGWFCNGVGARNG